MVANGLKTALLLSSLTALLLFIGNLIGGARGLTIAIVISLIFNLISYFAGDKIALRTYRAKLADKQKYHALYTSIEHLAKKASIPMPKVYIIPSQNPNAFATGRNPKNASVAVTEGILHLLNHHELEGVLAHELSHIKHRDILTGTIAATIAGIISYVASMARWAAIFGGFGGNNDNGGDNIISLLVLAILAPILALIIQLAISRSREFAADKRAATLQGTGKHLASALEKISAMSQRNPMRFGSKSSASLFISNPFPRMAFGNLFSTHPSTRDRVEKLKSY